MTGVMPFEFGKQDEGARSRHFVNLATVAAWSHQDVEGEAWLRLSFDGETYPLTLRGNEALEALQRLTGALSEHDYLVRQMACTTCIYDDNTCQYDGCARAAK